MKKAILLALLFLDISLLVTAQNKKVAVMETKVNEGVSSFQSNMVRGGLETAIANAIGYEGYDRASFDKIMQEHSFQRSGMVDDSQIKELGQMAGVQYVLVTEASTDGDGFFITAKILDVETGLLVQVANTFCNATGKDIYDASNKLGQQLFGVEIPNDNTLLEESGIDERGETVFEKVLCMDDDDFARIIKLIKKEGFEKGRLSIAKQVTASNPMCVQQIIDICKLFGFESSKLDFAKYAYPYCTQKENYYLLYETFNFSRTKKELERYINNTK
jgi:hypothetical protein